MTEKDVIEKLKSIIENQLHLECLEIEKNGDSTDGNVYMIKCSNDRFVAKVYDDKKHAKSMVILHNTISKELLIPRIIYSNLNDEATNNQYIVIYSFMQGTPIDQCIESGKIDKDIIIKIGKTIRKMHDIALNEDLFDLPSLAFEAINKRKTMLHFDLTKSNIFIEATGDISIIDFDDAKYGSAIYDVSILCAFFFFSEKRGVDLEGMKTFIEAYYGEDEELKKEETLLINECVNQWTGYLLSNQKLTDGLRDCFEAKCKMVNETLQ